MYIYTVVFTPKNKKPNENKYIDMLFIWLRFLHKYGKVTDQDKVYILIDSESKDYIQQVEAYMCLPIPHHYIEFTQPTTTQEGARERYEIYKHLDLQNEIVLYLDVDMLVLQDIHSIETQLVNKPNTILVYPEHNLRHFNYLGELTAEDMLFFDKFPELYRDHPGISSTCFAFQGTTMKAPFEELLKKMKTDCVVNYTLDQPFFNRLLLHHVYKYNTFNLTFLKKECLAYNKLKHQCTDEALLVNMCGEPGVQDFHWIKMFMALLADS